MAYELEERVRRLAGATDGAEQHHVHQCSGRRSGWQVRWFAFVQAEVYFLLKRSTWARTAGSLSKTQLDEQISFGVPEDIPPSCRGERALWWQMGV